MLSCVVVRYFAAGVVRQLEPDLPAGILIASSQRVRRVVALDRCAALAGVRAGMTLKQGLLLCPEAAVLPEQAQTYRRRAEEIAGELMLAANRLELEYQPTSTAFYLDTDGAADFMRGWLLAQGFVADHIGIGVAANKFTARVAAAYHAGQAQPLQVPAGDEAAFLAPYPVSLLPLNRHMARRLPLLGIYRLGQFAALPRSAVFEQFGAAGRWLHELARGHDIRPLQRFQPPAIRTHRDEFDDPISDRQILERHLQRAAGRLVAALDTQQARHLTLTVRLENGRQLETHATPPRAMGDVPFLWRQLLQALSRLAVDAPVSGLSVYLSGIHTPQPVQRSLFEAVPSQGLDDVLPEWIERHPQAAFYYSRLIEGGRLAPAEARFERVGVRRKADSA